MIGSQKRQILFRTPFQKKALIRKITTSRQHVFLVKFAAVKISAVSPQRGHIVLTTTFKGHAGRTLLQLLLLLVSGELYEKAKFGFTFDKCSVS